MQNILTKYNEVNCEVKNFGVLYDDLIETVDALRRKACRHEVTLKAREQMKCKLKDEIRMLYVIFSFGRQQSLQSPATRGLDLSPSEGQTTTDQFL